MLRNFRIVIVLACLDLVYEEHFFLFVSKLCILSQDLHPLVVYLLRLILNLLGYLKVPTLLNFELVYIFLLVVVNLVFVFLDFHFCVLAIHQFLLCLLGFAHFQKHRLLVLLVVVLLGKLDLLSFISSFIDLLP